MTFSVSVCLLFALIVTSDGAPDEIDNSTSITLPPTTEAPLMLEQTLSGIKGVKALLCSEKPCVRKCCPDGKVVFMQDPNKLDSGNCRSKKRLNLTLSFPDPVIYNRDREATHKTLNASFQIIRGLERILLTGLRHDKGFYVTEDGTLMAEFPNTYHHWREYDNDNYCIDLVHVGGGDVILRPFMLAKASSPVERNFMVSFVGVLISPVFLVATLAVYAYLPRLRRKLHGKVVMAFSAALLGYFLTHSILYLAYFVRYSSKMLCHAMALPSYYTILASFFWLTVMSFDIWSKYRGTVSNSTSKLENIRKFKWYCVYAFGAALAMTIMFAFLNYLPMDKINRSVVTPGIAERICSLVGTERFLYLYIPMVILIFANILLFVATSITIYKLKKSTETDPRKGHKTQYLLYSKMFLVMSLSWLLEIVSDVDPSLFVWEFTNALNCLMGLFVFLIFVCNKRVYRMFVAKYRGRLNNLRSSQQDDDDSRESDDARNRNTLLS